MAHTLSAAAPLPAHAAPPDLDTDAVHQARLELAACFRAAARLGLAEGICNHFSALLPGRDDLFLVNPYGLAFEDNAEGDRLAAALGNADVLFMQNHGVMVTGPNIAEAWDDLYYLERAAEVQLKAMSSGRPLKPIADDVARRTHVQMREGDPSAGRACATPGATRG